MIATQYLRYFACRFIRIDPVQPFLFYQATYYVSSLQGNEPYDYKKLYHTFCLLSILYSLIPLFFICFLLLKHHPKITHSDIISYQWSCGNQECLYLKKYYPTVLHKKLQTGLESGLANESSAQSSCWSSGTHSTLWHFIQSKKTHTHLNTGRSIT